MKPLERINHSVLGRIERPALAWMAERLPPEVRPDHLTAMGFAGAVLTATGFVLSRSSLLWLWLASCGLILNWVGDSLDGTAARLRRIERPRYGFFVDHTTDLFGQVGVFLALGLSPLAHFEVTCLGLIAFLMAFVYSLIGAQTQGSMRLTYGYFGPTEIRVLLLGGNLITLGVGVVEAHTSLFAALGWATVTLHDCVIGLLALAGILTIAALAVHDGRALAARDPPRGR